MATEHPTFELARFAWGAPDRLELSGKFLGLADVPDESPTLVISGSDGVHRLPVVPGTLSGPPEDGRRWDAVFAWQEPPVAFECAELELGDHIVVELPEPAAKRTRSRRQTLSVSRERPERSPELDELREDEGREDGVQQLRAQAELLTLQEGIRQLEAALKRSNEELGRVRHELGSERELRRADTERFNEALLAMGDAAEQAVASELSDARELVEAKDVALEELRAQLEAESAARAEAESEGRAEIDALRKQVVALEGADEDSDRLRAELDQARSALDEARTDAERLLERLSAVVGRTGDGA